MRYTVGQKVIAVRENFSIKEGLSEKELIDARWGTVCLPWYHTLEKFEIMTLTVLEHHKVPWEHGSDSIYDGYILQKEEDGTLWWNQYPTASYGQLDTSEDQRFRIAYPSNYEELPKEVQDAWVEEQWRPFKSAEFYFNNLHRGISEVRKHEGEEKAVHLETFAADRKTDVEKATGATLTREPLRFLRDDGTEVLSEIYVTKVTWPESGEG